MIRPFAVLLSAFLCLVLTDAASARTDKDCRDFTYQDQAQSYFISIGGSRTNNADNLDADGNGIACEVLPRRSLVTQSNLAAANDDGGTSWFWPVAVLALIGGGAWYYYAEVQGEHNKRAVHPPNLPYNTRTMPYEAYLKTPEWEAIRQMAFARDGRKCVKCGATERLQAHHLTYKRRGHEKVKDLQTLCRECHQKSHPDKLFG